ncbi:hypothetical protein Tco_0552130 [Tanacetum coccineum]
MTGCSNLLECMLFLPSYNLDTSCSLKMLDMLNTQYTYGSKSNLSVDTNSGSNDFVSCDNVTYHRSELNLNTAPVWKNVENIPSFVPRPAYFPAGSRNRPTSVPTSRPFPAGWHIPAARPMTRPKSHYFQQFNTPYPLSVSLMKKMLKHKLEVEVDGVGNDMTHAVQLIQFIKKQLASCVSSD